MTSRLTRLIDELTLAIQRAPCDKTTCEAVEAALVHAVETREPLLPAHLREPHPDHYARHLVHLDEHKRFSVIAMVWGPGQGTPIHDHGGLWCVECVVQGKIEVRAYRPVERVEVERVGFSCAEVIKAGQGEAGHLIPPLDHHVIHNPYEEPAVTLHVYGGEMAWCNAYRPHPDGGYVEVRKELSIDHD
ncbi:MAG: cysteine dioxygenase [Deltaproteobacteria bacterium]|nr:MAG: cysteine dioxygenase [Deltaproteobacteria bacterium]